MVLYSRNVQVGDAQTSQTSHARPDSTSTSRFLGIHLTRLGLSKLAVSQRGSKLGFVVCHDIRAQSIVAGRDLRSLCWRAAARLSVSHGLEVMTSCDRHEHSGRTQKTMACVMCSGKGRIFVVNCGVGG